MENKRKTVESNAIIHLQTSEIKTFLAELVALYPGKLELHLTFQNNIGLQSFGDNSPVSGSTNTGSVGGNLVTTI